MRGDPTGIPRFRAFVSTTQRNTDYPRGGTTDTPVQSLAFNPDTYHDRGNGRKGVISAPGGAGPDLLG